MTWIKICGTTNLEDALLAVEAGADALGFVFHEQSPRKIDPETARKIVDQLPPQVETVGVFVNQTASRIHEVARNVGLSAIQFHGDEGADFLREVAVGLDQGRAARTRYIKALSMSLNSELEAGNLQAQVDTFLLDSHSALRRGGTGTTFDWPQAKPFVERYKTIVAGGLTSANVGEAISILHPWGVDVASGVEAAPGKKDPQKIRAFIAAVRVMVSGS